MKFYIKNLGCKTNAVEAQIMAEKLIGAGFEETKEHKDADIYIINTCTVTAHSDNQVLYLIKQAKSENKNAKIVLTGCTVQTIDKNKIEGADLILGNSEKLDIEKYINLNDSFVKDIFETKKFENRFLHKTNSTRPSVKIQDGCNNRCSYCLIPYARGISRSNSIENIIKQINIHIQNNRKEVVLTGIHIGLFGADTGSTLIELLKEIEKTDIVRYRLGSLYINELDNHLLEFLSNSKKFCPHFHLSLQSMNDKILNKMNRKYTKDEAINVIKKIHSSFNLPYIGCDIITGFPYETDEDFKITKEALIESELSFIHSFPYSIRKGTAAERMEGHVLEHVKKERTKDLIQVSEVLHKNFLNKNKNKSRMILYERKGKNDLYSGITENYIKVYKKSDINIQNTIEYCNLADFDELY